MAVALMIAGTTLMALTTYNPKSELNYTRRSAASILRGKLGTHYPPPRWLTESFEHEGRYHNAFPLGSALSVLPFVWMTRADIIRPFPNRQLIALLAGAATGLMGLLASRYPLPVWKVFAFGLAPVFGTCLWPNLGYGGAWHLSLGFAVVGLLGAILLTTSRRRVGILSDSVVPFFAGGCFALAFGNRTETLIVAPAFYFLLLRGRPRSPWIRFAAFSILPFCLGTATLAYNHARFDSPLQFGHSLIPYVFEEEWYRDGIFHLSAIPRNAYAMLVEPWELRPSPPYVQPTGWGGSIFLSSPFLLLVLWRWRRGPFDLRVTAWAAIAATTLVLWLHGNPGGWQVSYRYASVLFPWAMLLLLETEKSARYRWLAPAAIALSIAINAYSNWLFNSSDFMRQQNPASAPPAALQSAHVEICSRPLPRNLWLATSSSSERDQARG